MADDRLEPMAGQEETVRLEAALNRIQRAAALRRDLGPPASGEFRPELSDIAARLDGLIAELHALLAPLP